MWCSARASASGCRCSTVGRTPVSWRWRPAWSGTYRGGWSECRSTRRADLATGSPCRPASSTSGVTRRPRTSAPLRCCSPWWRRCMPSTTARKGFGRSRSGPTATPPCSPRRCAVRISRSSTRPSSTRCPCVLPGRAAAIVSRARDLGLHLRLTDADRVGVSLSEVTTRAHVARVLAAFGVDDVDLDAVDAATPDALPDGLRRTTDYLTHPVFHAHHSETKLLRYLRRLSDRDYALDRGMIPLGSCTMKLNATAEMEPISLPGFADLHPFAPAEDATGYRELISTLEGLARRDHRLRSRVDPAERRVTGRVGRAGRDPRLPPGERGAGPGRLPDPVERPRHQRGLRGDGRHAGGRGEGRRRRRRRPRRPAQPSARTTPTRWRPSW